MSPPSCSNWPTPPPRRQDDRPDHVPRTDIGDYLGLTLETVSRTLAALKHDRVIDMAGPHHLLMLDRAALEEMTEGDEPAIRAGRAWNP